MPQLDLHPRTRGWIVGITIGFLALLLFVSLVGGAGPLGRWLSGLLILGFGWGAWFVPFIIGGAAWLVLRGQDERPIPGPMLMGSGAVLIAILGVLGVMGTEEFQPGGFVGSVIALPVASAVGKFIATVLFLGVGTVGGLILWNFPHHRRAPDGSALPVESSLTRPKKSLGEAASGLLGKVPSFKVKDVEKRLSEVKSASGGDDDENRSAEDPEEPAFKPQALDTALPYEPPPLDLLEGDKGKAKGGDVRSNMAIIKRTFANFHIPVEMGEVTVGPTVTQYTLKPAEGVKLAKIHGFDNDLALALAAHPIRIEAPIPGRALVGIEVPNQKVSLVRLRTLLDEPSYRESGLRLPIAIGRNVAGWAKVVPLDRMPHLLIAGATGTGKTIGLNAIIMSLLYQNPPSLLRLLLIDPKRVEFPVYNDIPHLLTPVIVDTDKTIHALRWAVAEMDRRFEILSGSRARDIETYNKRLKRDQETMPYIVIIIDELADLMATRGREVEAAIVRIAQMARAVGIHLVVATQRPSVEVITGLIKANITTRMAFQVASQIDSRTILDGAGAEKLLGNGDMLFVSADSSKPMRLQGAFVSEQEVKRVTDFLKQGTEPDYIEDVTEPQSGIGEHIGGHDGPIDSDPLFDEAERLVIETRKASASYLQRRLRVGYARAARLLDLLEERGIVGPGEGAKPREILIESASDWEDAEDAEDTDDEK